MVNRIHVPYASSLAWPKGADLLCGHRWLMKLIGVLLMLLSISGCARDGYLQKRAHDAADIFTLTVGAGAGAKARIGPFHAGLFGNMDMAGLRGGTVASKISLDDPLGMEGEVSFFSIDVVDGDTTRGKNYCGVGGPLLSLPNDSVMSTTQLNSRHIPYFTQIEVAAGLGPTLRAGFNPGELVDFIVGWFNVDLFDDDIRR